MTSRIFTKPTICITFPRAEVRAQHSADVVAHSAQHSAAEQQLIVDAIESRYPMIDAYVDNRDNVPTVRMSATARKLCGATDAEIEAIVHNAIQAKIEIEGIQAQTPLDLKSVFDEELPTMTPDPAYAAQIKGLREMTNAINSGLLPSTTPDGVTVVTEGRHIGAVVRMEGDYAIQDVGRGDEVAHPLSRFEAPPEVGKKMDVSYVDGLARVAKALSQDEHAVSVSVNTR